jgi:hypothetical protein
VAQRGRGVADRAEPKGAIDWTAINLTASVALVSSLFHVEEWILSSDVSVPIQDGVNRLTWFLAERTLGYGLPFAAAFLVIRMLDLAAPLRAVPVVAWTLFLCSILLHVDRIGDALVFQVLIPDEVYFPFIVTLPLPARQAATLGGMACWLWVGVGFVVALLRGRAALHRPTSSEIAVALFAGVGLPAAASTPLVLETIKYRELYAAQETRFRELCKNVKTEIFGAASGAKTVFFDPNESLSCWDVHDGQCRVLDRYDGIAQYLVINWQLESVEFWEKPGRGKPPELKRCYQGYDCRSIKTVTAKYRAVARDIQSKADEPTGLRRRVITVDDRETGKVLGELQFIYSTETHRLCAPGAEEDGRFSTDEFVVRALGVERRKRPDR